jgi:Spy/CpxP family protein refolding chaperone
MSLVLVLLACPAVAQVDDAHHSGYAGMESREIKTLSAQDIAELRSGHGWGLSLVAELNGVPGPRHLLDMQGDLGLTPDQVARLQAIYDDMKKQAVPLGQELIEGERALEEAFADGSLDEKELRRRLHRIARVRGDLRYVHLSAHLKTPPLLSEEQIRSYNSLRGYDGQDPCSSVPPGHDPEMWRRHNHCDD